MIKERVMERYVVALLNLTDQPQPPSQDYLDHDYFDVRLCAQSTDLLATLAPALLLLNINSTEINSGDANTIKQQCHNLGVPVILRVNNLRLDEKIQALEAGFQDIVCSSEEREQLTPRLLTAIYHHIANQQLQATLTQANQAAFSAMNESSNLGNNIQFLLALHHCNNLDELGQVCFRTLSQYDLNCSLQMRSCFEVKNMDANGMARPLESELLSQLKDAGRYYDFGQRTVMNYGCVSLLVKNMPSDELRYGMVKDNTFTMLQGMDARVRALDEHQQLEQEKNALEQLSKSVSHVMKGLEMEFHAVTQQIVERIENAAGDIEKGIPSLMLNEEDEAFIETTLQHCITQVNRDFHQGLRIENHFEKLEQQIAKVLQLAKTHNVAPAPPSEAPTLDNQDIELF
jgi:hypothetical protein